jgi:hypothetical protein
MLKVGLKDMSLDFLEVCVVHGNAQHAILLQEEAQFIYLGSPVVLTIGKRTASEATQNVEPVTHL